MILSFPRGRAEHESAELFLQASLQTKVVPILEKKCGETREGCSAYRASEQCSFYLDGNLLVSPHSVQLFPSAVCGPYPLVNLRAH